METNQDDVNVALAALVDHNQPLSTQSDAVHKRIVSNVPPSIWAHSSNGIGLIKNAEPIQESLKQNAALPRVPQYPLSQEKREGIHPIIQSLLDQGIIVPCTSPCNTPILPVKKSGNTDLWRT